VERQVVRVVGVVCSAKAVLEMGDDVISFEQPVHVLPGVFLAIGMAEEGLLYLPFPQIGRGCEHEDIAVGLGGRFLVRDGPVAVRLPVVADREFRTTARKVNDVSLTMVREFFAVI